MKDFRVENDTPSKNQALVALYFIRTQIYTTTSINSFFHLNRYIVLTPIFRLLIRLGTLPIERELLAKARTSLSSEKKIYPVKQRKPSAEYVNLYFT
jgi:hypothetical protein